MWDRPDDASKNPTVSIGRVPFNKGFMDASCTIKYDFTLVKLISPNWVY